MPWQARGRTERAAGNRKLHASLRQRHVPRMPPQRYPQRFNYFSSRTFAATQVRVATTERHQRSAERLGKLDGVVGFVSVPARGPSAKHLSQRKGFTTGSALGCMCLPSLPGGNATTG